MKKFMKVIGIILGILVVIAGSGALFINAGMDKASTVTTKGKTAIGLKDGVYEGQYTGGRFSNTLQVIVKKEAILDIAVIKPVTIELEGYRDKFTSSVLNAQSTDIDAITGATLTTNAYLKSVENALASEPLKQ